MRDLTDYSKLSIAQDILHLKTKAEKCRKASIEYAKEGYGLSSDRSATQAIEYENEFYRLLSHRRENSPLR